MEGQEFHIAKGQPYGDSSSSSHNVFTTPLCAKYPQLLPESESSFFSVVLSDWHCPDSCPQDSLFLYCSKVLCLPMPPLFFFTILLALLAQEWFYSKTMKSVRPSLIEAPVCQWTSPMGRNTGGWYQLSQNLLDLFCTGLSKCGPPSAAWCPTAMASLCTAQNLGMIFTSLLTLVGYHLKFSRNSYLSCSQEF